MRVKINMRKIKVAVLFGGVSSEHEVSLHSGKNVIREIDKNRFEVIPIGVDKDGKWWLYRNEEYLLNKDSAKNIALDKNAGEQVVLLPQGERELYSVKRKEVIEKIDVVFSLMHGILGEDGNTQGLLKLAGVPFVGSGVLGSSVGMDKDFTKRLLRDSGIAVSKFITLYQNEKIEYEDAKIKLGLPMFIKPANQGSSVGVSKVRNKDEFYQAISNAFKYDNKILIEEFVDGREVECAVIGNEHLSASVVGEIIPSHDFYSYEAKYVDDNGAKCVVPAVISEDITKKIQALSMMAFKIIGCNGLARVDFFLTKENKLIINEINTLPGFTKISMYPQLWQHTGKTYADLISELIQLALEKDSKDKSKIS